MGLFGICLATLFAAMPGAQAASPMAATAQASAGTKADNLRNTRYCEVLTVARKLATFTVKVYNTLGLNLCPSDRWSALDAKAIAKERKLTLVKLNGPRYWTLDAIEGHGLSATAETEKFGGLDAALRATIKTRIWQGTVGNKFYTPNKVRRDTVFYFKAGKPVYELTSPAGDVYMMQSYSQIVNAKLSLDDLPNLGDRLKLPLGWQFQSRILTSDYALKADGLAYVINDDLYNSYQRRPK